MVHLLSICLGIGLSAACGFRVFIPLLAAGIASFSGHMTLSHGLEWIGTYPALMAFATAAIFEIAAYYIPWFDNLMDAISSPAAKLPHHEGPCACHRHCRTGGVMHFSGSSLRRAHQIA